MKPGIPQALVLSVLLTLNAVGQKAEEPQIHPRIVALKRMKLATLPGGTLPTYYSSGFRDRAMTLQTYIEGERAFYRARLGVTLDDLALSVLNPSDWSRVEPTYPYGVPSVEGHDNAPNGPRVIMMPAEWKTVSAMPLPSEHETSPDLLAEAKKTGQSWQQLMAIGGDGIGAHEVGHAVVEDYGIESPVYWLNELLASYAGDVYVEEKVPADIRGNHMFWWACREWPHPHTSLAYFESHYEELATKDPRNYGWYQCSMDQRVLTIYKREGVAFLKKIRIAFPKGGPKLDSEQTLDKLEGIEHGWKAWARELEAGHVE